jgi:arylsulfatase A
MPRAKGEHPVQPNIVVILADDVGYGDVGCLNPSSRIPTPAIDRLAARGMVFTDTHSCSSVCTPSRYGILTGRYCWRTPLKRSVLYSYEPPLIEAGRPTIASILQGAGYHTACIGKWHLGLGYTSLEGRPVDFGRPLPWGDAPRTLEESIDFHAPIFGGPLALGFDVFFGTSGCSTCQPPYGFIDSDRFVTPPSIYVESFPYTGRPGMTSAGWDHAEADPVFSRTAVDFILAQKQSSRPFFLYLATSAAHEPCVEAVVPRFARGRSAAGPRGDLVWLFDWMVSQLLDALDRADKLENTAIFVTSDNGALPGDRIVDDSGRETYRNYGHASCGPWRGYKAHIWEGGHREPLVAAWPSSIEPGSRCSALVGLQDLPATLAAIAGADLPEGAAEDSRSFLPLLLGQRPNEPVRDSLVHHSGAGVFSIRSGPWKLIHESLGSGGWPPPTGSAPVAGSPGQLYHLERDPAERKNLFHHEKGIVHELTELLFRQGAGPVQD